MMRGALAESWYSFFLVNKELLSECSVKEKLGISLHNLFNQLCNIVEVDVTVKNPNEKKRIILIDSNRHKSRQASRIITEHLQKISTDFGLPLKKIKEVAFLVKGHSRNMLDGYRPRSKFWRWWKAEDGLLSPLLPPKYPGQWLIIPENVQPARWISVILQVMEPYSTALKTARLLGSTDWRSLAMALQGIYSQQVKLTSEAPLPSFPLLSEDPSMGGLPKTMAHIQGSPILDDLKQLDRLRLLLKESLLDKNAVYGPWMAPYSPAAFNGWLMSFMAPREIIDAYGLICTATAESIVYIPVDHLNNADRLDDIRFFESFTQRLNTAERTKFLHPVQIGNAWILFSIEFSSKTSEIITTIYNPATSLKPGEVLSIQNHIMAKLKVIKNELGLLDKYCIWRTAEQDMTQLSSTYITHSSGILLYMINMLASGTSPSSERDQNRWRTASIKAAISLLTVEYNKRFIY